MKHMIQTVVQHGLVQTEKHKPKGALTISSFHFTKAWVANPMLNVPDRPILKTLHHQRASIANHVMNGWWFQTNLEQV